MLRGDNWPALVLLSALLVRLPFVAIDTNTTTDLATFRGWARTIRADGLTTVYQAPGVDYPPLFLYAFGATAAVESRLPGANRTAP
jgi:hypothetical protein